MRRGADGLMAASTVEVNFFPLKISGKRRYLTAPQVMERVSRSGGGDRFIRVQQMSLKDLTVSRKTGSGRVWSGRRDRSGGRERERRG